MTVTHYLSATNGLVPIAEMHALHIANAITRLERLGKTRDPVYAALLHEAEVRKAAATAEPAPEPDLPPDALVRAPARIKIDRAMSNEVGAGPVTITIRRDPKPLGVSASASIDRGAPMARMAPSAHGQSVRFVKR